MSLAARVGRAIFWGQAGRLAEAILFFAFSLLLARMLGPASYGLYALGTSLAGICAFLALLGIGPETLGRFLPELVSSSGVHHAETLLKKLLVIRSAAVLLLAAFVFSFQKSIGEHLHIPLFSGTVATMLLMFAARSFLDLLTCFSSGLLNLRRVAAAKLVAACVTPSIFLAFSLCHASTAIAAWLAMAGGSIAGILVLGLPFLLAPSSSSSERVLPIGRILAFGMFAWATNFFVFVLGDSTDVLLISWLVPDRAAIGQYAVGAKIVFSVTGLLLGWASMVSVAALSDAWQQGGMARISDLVVAQWKLGVLCLVAPYLLLIRFAREIVAIFYSPAYGGAVPVIRILSALMACGVLCGFSMHAGILYALNHERLACGVVGAAALFNICGEILLVRWRGIAGAAWATGLSFLLLAILCTATGSIYVPLRVPFLFIGKIVGSAVMALAATLWLHPASLRSLGEGFALYGVMFLGGLVLLKPLSGKDSDSLHHVNRFLGKWAEKLFVELPAMVREERV